MKKIWGIVWVLIVVVTVCFLYHSRKPAAAPGTAPAATTMAGQSGNPSVPQNNPVPAASSPGANSILSLTPPANLAANASMVEPATVTTTPPPNIPPEIVVENVRHAITQYGAMFGGNPVGTNPEITAELNGNNPKQINFIKPEAGMRINKNGELVDAWGTPLFFHQLSGTDTEVRSAGPDKIMWNLDDLVAK